MVVILITMKRFTILLALSLLLLLSGCGSYPVATFPLVTIRGIDAKELCSARLEADAVPIRHLYDMPETEENKHRMVNFTDMLEPDDLQTVIDSAAAAQGSSCIGLQDVEITYEWLAVPFLSDSYGYTVKGTPVRKK